VSLGSLPAGLGFSAFHWSALAAPLLHIQGEAAMELRWRFDEAEVDWNELSELYRIAPLGVKLPEDLKVAFSNSMFKCFVYHENLLIGAGRALADGKDCSYLADIAVNPKYQGLGLGKAIVQELVRRSEGHKKIILYTSPGKEGFYAKLGFKRLNTAMAIFQNAAEMLASGTLSEP
jgi:ribosomal protein S18 acetylase RimI-like enzyme